MYLKELCGLWYSIHDWNIGQFGAKYSEDFSGNTNSAVDNAGFPRSVAMAACTVLPALGTSLVPGTLGAKSIGSWCVSPSEPICIFYLWRHTINQTRVSAGDWIGYLCLLLKVGGTVFVPRPLEGALALDALGSGSSIQCLVQLWNGPALTHPTFIWQIFLSIAALSGPPLCGRR